jgi:hypothetical protein
MSALRWYNLYSQLPHGTVQTIQSSFFCLFGGRGSYMTPMETRSCTFAWGLVIYFKQPGKSLSCVYGDHSHQSIYKPGNHCHRRFKLIIKGLSQTWLSKRSHPNLQHIYQRIEVEEINFPSVDYFHVYRR